MFDNNVFIENSTENYSVKGNVEGFQLKTYITYYRGIPCSMVHDIQVFLDDERIPRENILFSIDGEDFFTLDQLETVTTYKWEFGSAATIRVQKKNGLPSGEHKIKLVVGVRVAYVPVPFVGEKTRIVKI